jgi:hypothetical protein
MNLARLKKSQLVRICMEEDIDPTGTIEMLKERILSTQGTSCTFWDLRFVRVRLAKSKVEVYEVDTRFYNEQVSDEKMYSFEHWSEYVLKKLDEDGMDVRRFRVHVQTKVLTHATSQVPPMWVLRDAYDQGNHPRDFLDYRKRVKTN